jgi:hypothetical protein
LHEYQKKGLTKKAFRNSLILKGAILIVLDEQRTNGYLEKEGGASSGSPNGVFYRVKYTSRQRGSQGKLWGKTLGMSVCGARRGLELAQRRGPGEILRFAQDDNGSGASL